MNLQSAKRNHTDQKGEVLDPKGPEKENGARFVTAQVHYQKNLYRGPKNKTAAGVPKARGSNRPFKG